MRKIEQIEEIICLYCMGIKKVLKEDGGHFSGNGYLGSLPQGDRFWITDYKNIDCPLCKGSGYISKEMYLKLINKARKIANCMRKAVRKLEESEISIHEQNFKENFSWFRYWMSDNDGYNLAHLLKKYDP